MSFRDRFNNIPFKITTGDKKEYFPVMQPYADLELNFNTNDYIYLGQEGTFVSRQKAQGEVISIDFFFEGDDHIDQANTFRKSCKDNRQWKIEHPFFDNINVQPGPLKFGMRFGISNITGSVRISLPEQLPNETVDLTADVIAQKELVDSSAISSAIPDDIDTGRAGVNILSANYALLPNTNPGVKVLKDSVRKAASAANEILTKPVRFSESIKNLANFPNQIASSITQSYDAMLASINEMLDLVSDSPSSTDLNTSLMISAGAENAVNAAFDSANDVRRIQSQLQEMYDNQLSALESVDGYDQDNILAFNLSVLVAKTLGRLNEIAFEAKQERTITTTREMSYLTLVAELYEDIDEGSEKLALENGFTDDELNRVPAGRDVVYYV